jgi:N6-adenosine-specific RNA methylase IME4
MSTLSSPSKVLMVGLGGIAVSPERLRALRPDRVAEIAASMQEGGLLQPIVLRTGKGNGYWLVAGRHRFEAAKLLKWDSIRACVFEDMEAVEAELAEIDENLIRADLSPAERALHVHARKALYEKLHPETKQGFIGRGRKKSSQNEKSFVKDTAKKTGKGRSTVARDATRGKNATVLPDIVGTSLDSGDELDALAKLDEGEQLKLAERAKAGEKVSAKTTVKQVKRAEREQELGQKQQALPNRKFGVIYADPEWRWEPWSRETGMDRAADNHYPTSVLDEIKARDVTKIAASDCALFLWATPPMLDAAIEVLKAWGFDYVTNGVWVKPFAGTGYWFRFRHEHLLLGIRGKVPCPAPGDQWDSVIEQPRGEHSEKPEAVCEMIEAYFPNLPKIELNRRGPARPGWDAWGNEVDDGTFAGHCAPDLGARR